MGKYLITHDDKYFFEFVLSQELIVGFFKSLDQSYRSVPNKHCIPNEFVKSWEQQNKRMGDESVVNNKHNKREIINIQCTDIVNYLWGSISYLQLFISLIEDDQNYDHYYINFCVYDE